MARSEADYLKELVAFPSVSADKQASRKCARYCADFFKKHGMHTKLIESDGYPNVFASSQKTKWPKVLLQCHMDVVPAQEDLFSMKTSGDKLMGRGTFDMKFACASYMKLLENMGDNIQKYDFGIMLSFDEEIGGHNGVEALLKQGYGADICILPDSGRDWHLEIGAHGAWFLKLTKTGRSAHASMPENGVNAAEILIKAINEIKDCAEKSPRPDLQVSLTRINSGKAINQIPDYAEASLDIRFKTSELREKLEAKINRICSNYGAGQETVVLANCMSVDIKKPGLPEFVNTVEQVIGRKISTGHSTGATDARYFCANDIPCIVIQPNGGGRHADDEWVDKKGLEHLTEILSAYISAHATL